MTPERMKIASELLQEGIKEYADGRYAIGVGWDNRSLSTRGIPQDSEVAKQLEELGFKIIYPAGLTEEIVKRLSDRDRYMYDARNDNILVIDPTAKGELSLDFAEEIINHVNSLLEDFKDTSLYGYAGYDLDDKTTLTYLERGIDPAAEENLVNLLNEIGFKAEFSKPLGNSRGIKVEADEPRKHSNRGIKSVEISDYEDFHREAGDGHTIGTVIADLRGIQAPEEVRAQEELV